VKPFGPLDGLLLTFQTGSPPIASEEEMLLVDVRETQKDKTAIEDGPNTDRGRIDTLHEVLFLLDEILPELIGITIGLLIITNPIIGVPCTLILLVVGILHRLRRRGPWKQVFSNKCQSDDINNDASRSQD